MMRRLGIAAALLLGVAPACLGEALAVAGNGGLSVTIGTHGEILACRWPSPGYYNQLGPGPAGWRPATHDRGATLLDSPLVLTRRTHAGMAAATQTQFVHPTLDLFVSHLELGGAPAGFTLDWDAAFAPRTRLIPELPIDSAGGFAAFQDEEGATLYLFRPSAPGRADYAARDNGDDAFWQEYGVGEGADPGVWIGVCSLGEGAPAIVTAPRDGVGARLSFTVGGDFAATVVAAFARSKAEVDVLLAEARARGYTRLRAETEAHWRGWIAPAGEVPDAEKRARLTLAMLTGREGGNTSRNLLSTALAVDRPEEGVWIALAKDFLGQRDAAGREFAAYGAAVHKEVTGGAPTGALPVARYSDGSLAAPPWLVSLDAAGWFVCGVWRHAMFLEGEARTEFLLSLRESVGNSTGFLATWTEGSRGAPLHSYQSRLGRDGRSKQTLLLNYLGLECGIRIHEVLGLEQESHWARRRDDLAALVSFGVLNQEAPWPLDARIPLLMREILPDSYAAWKAYRNSASVVVSRQWDAQVEVAGVTTILGEAEIQLDADAAAWDARHAATLLIAAAQHRSGTP